MSRSDKILEAFGAADITTLCICYYKPEQWDAFLASMSEADRADYPTTFEEWSMNLFEDLRQVVNKNAGAKKVAYTFVTLDVELIKEFCQREGIRNDGQARAQLAHQLCSIKAKAERNWPY